MNTDLTTVIGEQYDKLASDSTLPINESSEVKTEVEETQEPTVAVEQPKPEEQPKTEETFTKLDLKALTPEGKQVYDKLAKDYVWATQRLANRYKPQIEEREKRIAELEAQLKGNKPQTTQTTDSDSTNSSTEVVDLVRKELESNWIEDQETEFLALDPRLNEESPDFDKTLFLKVTAELNDLAEQFAQERGSRYRFPYSQRAKDLIVEYDQAIDKAAQTRAEAKAQKAKAETQVSRKRNPDGTFSNTTKIPGNMTYGEGFDKAWEQLNN